MSRQTAAQAGQLGASARGRVALGAGPAGYDADIYGGGEEEEKRVDMEVQDDDDDEQIANQRSKSTYDVAREEMERTKGPDIDPFEGHRTRSRVSDRDNEYRVRRLERGFSPVRRDAFAEEEEASKASQASTKGSKAATAEGEDVRTYKDIMMEQQLARDEAEVLRNIAKRKREEEEKKAAGVMDALPTAGPAASAAAATAGGLAAVARKRRRWDDAGSASAAEAGKSAAAMPAAAATASAVPPSDSLLDDSENWAATPQRAEGEEEEEDEDTFAGIEPGQELNAWDATPVVLPTRKGRSRWDQADATPLPGAGAADATPLHTGGAADATPLFTAGGETPVGAPKKRSRWGETPISSSLHASADSGSGMSGVGPGMATPMHLTSEQWKEKLASMTPEQLQNLRIEAEIAERNKPLTDEELDALLPGEKDGYQILIPPDSYKPIRTPSRKLLMTPTPFGEEGFFIPLDTPGLKEYDVPPTPAESGLPAFQKAEDEKFFGKLLEDVDESTLSPQEAKERRIMKLLLKIKNGTPPQRKTALRTITDKAREFGAAALFDQILPILLSPTVLDQERHMLVKVIDRILYKLDDLVRPYVHKILIVIEPMLIEEDYYARVEGREIISNLAKAAGLATMIATMRPDIDNPDEYVRNVSSRAFAVVASALGVHSLLPFLKAVCQSRKSWEARHTGIKIVQQIAILSGCAVLAHLKSLVSIIEHGLTDEQSKVRCICALALAALAEAAHPYGIESFDTVLRPLWKGIRQHRGKTLAAFLKAIGYIIPLMDAAYASYYTKEVMVILIREFASPDEEMKKIVLKVVKQCVQSNGVEAEYIRTEILPPFFKHFWQRRMALDKRNYNELVSTTEALAQKVGAAAIISRIVDDLKDESEVYRKMVMETIDKILASLGAADIDEGLEQQLVDGALYAFQEQTSEDTRTMLNGFGVIINSLGQRAKVYLPQVAGIIKWRLNNKLARVRQQAADLIARIAIVLKTCDEVQLMQHLGVVLYEYLGEEYPEVLASILGALKSIVNVIGMADCTPPIKDLLPRLTPILRNRHEKVQENVIDLVGRIADRGAEYVSAKEWMRICFELLEMLKAHKKGIRRATVNCFGFIARAIGPHDVLATLLNNLKVQERQNRVCTTVAIAIVAETCAPFTVLPALMNEYRVPELNVQNGVLKALSFLFEYIGEMGKDYVYSLVPLLEDALMDRDAVHRQTAASVVKHMSLGVHGLGREDAMAHLLNYVWPNIFETSPHVINAMLDAIEGLRTALGPTKILLYLLQGLFHPARKVRTVYWKIYNTLYVSCQDQLVAAYPRLTEPKDDQFRRWELEQFL